MQAIAAAYVVGVIAMVIGWIANVIQIVNLALSHSPVDAFFVLKAIGIFAFPIGGVLGWVGMF